MPSPTVRADSKLRRNIFPNNFLPWLVLIAGGFLLSCLILSVAVSFTSYLSQGQKKQGWFYIREYIHCFLSCEWPKPATDFKLFSLKIGALTSSSKKKCILLSRRKIWRVNQANQPGKSREHKPGPREVVPNWAESYFAQSSFFLARGEEQWETVVFTGYAITRLEMLATQAAKV